MQTLLEEKGGRRTLAKGSVELGSDCHPKHFTIGGRGGEMGKRTDGGGNETRSGDRPTAGEFQIPPSRDGR
ncbi:hypothetical protein niasHS_010224 [Heterodera schachtii]|uniref:Uncharacterized protein n=1 Tax=Heterodera schachtii TaxID=97005 RepID=A0ABD2J4Z7_HETSC